MTKDIFIRSIGNVSPQKTIESKGFPEEIMHYPESQYLRCLDPDYRKYLDPMASRRMSRIVKLSLFAAKKCLEDVGGEMPDAIITGTGLGCVEDTEKFLSSIINDEEKLLNPTPFIQSTHNTIGAQISLALGCHGYNFTYAHRGFSFETALTDALLLLREGSAKTVLLGGVDEMTEKTFQITKRLNFWKKEKCDHLKIFEKETNGSIGGEGSCFFLLSDQPGTNDLSRIADVHTFYKPKGHHSVKKEIDDFLEKNNLFTNDIDVVITGLNGDNQFDSTYYHHIQKTFKDNIIAVYKHLCGEYNTSTAFAMWLASIILKTGSVPELVKFRGKPAGIFKNVLIYNHYRDLEHSLILLRNA